MSKSDRYESLRKSASEQARSYCEAIFTAGEGLVTLRQNDSLHINNEEPNGIINSDNEQFGPNKASDIDKPEEKASLSEKGKVLESLNDFASEQIESSPDGVVKFQGGEIVVNNSKGAQKTGDNSYQLIEFEPANDVINCEACLVNSLKVEGGQIISNYKQYLSSDLKVLAIGEDIEDSESEKTTESFDLFNKMMKAMGLKDEEYSYCNFSYCESKKEKCYNKLYQEIIDVKPTVILSFGAVATNILLNRREKLSSIHGNENLLEFKNKSTADSHQLSLYAIFHPSYLLINPGMKKTAWDDLKKVMARLS